MSKTNDPWEVASMGELLALAGAMEQEAIDGYRALAERMAEAGHLGLAAVFEELIADEKDHLGKVDSWSNDLDLPKILPPAYAPEKLFDDEGADLASPELLSAYRAFSIAVRNEERAFVFWTYVAAHAKSAEIAGAAERMAKEELGHVAKLRGERRRAFHRERDMTPAGIQGDLASLEGRLADQLQAKAALTGAADGRPLLALAMEARHRADLMSRVPFGNTPFLERVQNAVVEQTLPLCEFLTDCYLDLAEREKDELQRERAQQFAAGLIYCLRAVRAMKTDADQ